jgi:NAD(P)-dependent dehydrogenase (short-subunit alcohol dehydrogenase family)
MSVIERLFSLHGRVALITGAAGGIGSVLAKGMADAGATVALADVRAAGAQSIAAGIREAGHAAEAFVVDAARQESIRSLVDAVAERFSRIDILVNCAGINKREPLLEVTQETFERILAVNLRGVFQLSQAVAGIMIRQGGGKIIHIGSLTGEMALAGVSAYGVSKAGVSQLAMSMAVEWARHNIQVNCIVPGFMRTELTTALWADEAKAAWMRGRIAAQRPGEPDELLGAAILLASPGSSYVTGQTWCVDGGVTAGGHPW